MKKWNWKNIKYISLIKSKENTIRNKTKIAKEVMLLTCEKKNKN